MPVNRDLIAILPASLPQYEQAIAEAGGQLAQLDASVSGLVWTAYSKPDLLIQTLQSNPQLTWVQLPWAGVDAFSETLGHPVRFTSAKGAYREPVAEHALALALALGRKIPERVRAKSWGEKFAASLFDANVVIVGAGGITEELVRLLEPFRSRITVVRNREVAFPGVEATVPLPSLQAVLGRAHFVFLACALTSETRHLFDREMFAAMRPESYLVNIARGPVVVTADLLAALEQGVIAGAGIDVTDPEPLPSGHPAWDCENLIITPHTADTPEQVVDLFAERIRVNVLAHRGLGEWVGTVNPQLGY